MNNIKESLSLQTPLSEVIHIAAFVLIGTTSLATLIKYSSSSNKVQSSTFRIKSVKKVPGLVDRIFGSTKQMMREGSKNEEYDGDATTTAPSSAAPLPRPPSGGTWGGGGAVATPRTNVLPPWTASTMIAMKENASDQDSNRRSHRYNSHVPHEEDEGASTKTPKKASSTRGDEDAMKTEVDGSGGDDDNDNDAMTTTISTTTTTTFAGPSAEDIRRIVVEFLAENKSCRVEGLLSRIAGLERDMAHKDEIHEVLQSEYAALKSLVEVREGSDGELRQTLAEQRDKIERYAKEVRRLDPQVLTDHLDSGQMTIATLEATPRANDEYKYEKGSPGPRRRSVTSKVERRSNVKRRRRERPFDDGGRKSTADVAPEQRTWNKIGGHQGEKRKTMHRSDGDFDQPIFEKINFIHHLLFHLGNFVRLFNFFSFEAVAYIHFELLDDIIHLHLGLLGQTNHHSVVFSGCG